MISKAKSNKNNSQECYSALKPRLLNIMSLISGDLTFVQDSVLSHTNC